MALHNETLWHKVDEDFGYRADIWETESGEYEVVTSAVALGNGPFGNPVDRWVYKSLLIAREDARHTMAGFANEH